MTKFFLILVLQQFLCFPLFAEPPQIKGVLSTQKDGQLKVKVDDVKGDGKVIVPDLSLFSESKIQHLLALEGSKVLVLGHELQHRLGDESRINFLANSRNGFFIGTTQRGVYITPTSFSVFGVIEGVHFQNSRIVNFQPKMRSPGSEFFMIQLMGPLIESDLGQSLLASQGTKTYFKVDGELRGRDVLKVECLAVQRPKKSPTDGENLPALVTGKVRFGRSVAIIQTPSGALYPAIRNLAFRFPLQWATETLVLETRRNEAGVFVLDQRSSVWQCQSVFKTKDEKDEEED